MIVVSNHSKDADQFEAQLRQNSNLPTVDVFIPTYNESPELLDATMCAAQVLEYPSDLLRIYVLDDGAHLPDEEAENRSLRLATTCARRGVEYIARPSHAHAKAGNLDYAYRCSSGTFILLLDADFQVLPKFLLRTLGFLLYRSDVGIVQTPQCFRNADSVSENLSVHVPDEQRFFMAVTQPSRDYWGNAFCVGTGCVIRRSVLDAMGGFPKQTITEDLELSYAALLHGQRTLYLNETLAFGLAPESVLEFIKQRVRWCVGTMQQLWISTGPIWGRHRLIDRIFYLTGVVYWFSYVFMILLVIAPLVFWYTGIPVIQGHADHRVLCVLASWLVARSIILIWLSERTLPPVIVLVKKLLPAFHICGALLTFTVRPFGTPFKVSGKQLDRQKTEIRWPLFCLFFSLAVAQATAIALNLTGVMRAVEESNVLPLNVLWALFALSVCVLCCKACIEKPQTRRESAHVSRLSLTRLALTPLKWLVE